MDEYDHPTPKVQCRTDVPDVNDNLFSNINPFNH